MVFPTIQHFPQYLNLLVHPDCAAAIDMERDALKKQKTWTYIKKSPKIQPAPFKWTFRAIQVDDSQRGFFFKDRCVLRGYLQQPYQDFDPENVDAPVAFHVSHRLLLAIAPAKKFILEAADVTNS